jgi:hypothetical protein
MVCRLEVLFREEIEFRSFDDGCLGSPLGPFQSHPAMVRAGHPLI